VTRDPFEATRSAIGKLIKERRKERGWNQTQLGKQVGVDQTTVSEWERGVSLPRDLRRVTEALDIPIEQLQATIEAAVHAEDKVEEAIRLQTVLSIEARQALVTIYRKVLAAEIAQRT
jgi:transcriptional regulator with XRE-family HTH domain